MLERICGALADGESVRAGPILFAPDHLEIQRPSTITLGAFAFLFGVLAFFPAITYFAADRKDADTLIRTALLGSPLVVAALTLVLARVWRRRHPVHVPVTANVAIENGQLVLPVGKRAIAIELRFLSNALLVPVAQFLRKRA
jgi:hypothetical protein